jgi:hypothetical protein
LNSSGVFIRTPETCQYFSRFGHSCRRGRNRRDSNNAGIPDFGLRLRPFGNAQQDAQEHLLRTLGISAPSCGATVNGFEVFGENDWWKQNE